MPWRCCERTGPLRLLPGQPCGAGFLRRDAGKVGTVAHGGVTVNAPGRFLFIAIYRFGALFKYDGFDGGGDPVWRGVDVNGDGFLDCGADRRPLR